MELANARFLVAGATGALGGAIARDLAGAGARVAAAGRDAERLAEAGRRLGGPAVRLDYAETGSAEACVREAVAALGGLDGIVIATGAVAFGPADELPDEVARALFEVNVLGPMALLRAVLRLPEPPTAIAALSAIVADHPTAGMASYSAAKAALSAHLVALRREWRRRGVQVLDVRPPHLDTGFEGRALAGVPPRLPSPGDHRELAGAVVDALREDRAEILYDLARRELIVR